MAYGKHNFQKFDLNKLLNSTTGSKSILYGISWMWLKQFVNFTEGSKPFFYGNWKTQFSKMWLKQIV